MERYATWADPLTGLPSDPALCAHPGDDPVRDVFCSAEPTEIASLHDLQQALAVGPDAPAGISGAAFAAHSTSLSARSVSTINPRTIMFRLDIAPAALKAGSPEMVALSFTRGEQFAEMVAFDRNEREYSFYLLKFEQPCNESDRGCSPGDLLTEAAEQDWQNATLYDEAALANTTLDCAPCHQPDGPNTPKLLRMQEFDSPWTHWFFESTEGGKALLEDYTHAKGDEHLAGFSAEQIAAFSPGGLELFVGSRNHDQPNVFDSERIEQEVRQSAAMDGGNQPFDNRVTGESPTWTSAHQRARRGESIPVPYHNVKVTDPDKLEVAAASYQAYRAGALDKDELPDIRDVFPDAQGRLAEMGMMTQPGASGEEVLMEACSMCHNDRLDPSLSRAHFNADLTQMGRAERDRAIERLTLPPDDVRAMPPARLRVLSAEAIERAIEALQRDP